MSNYVPHTVTSMLKLKSKFQKSKLYSIEKDSKNWSWVWKGYKFVEFDLNGNVGNKDIKIYTMNTYPEGYDALGGEKFLVF